MLKLRTLDWNVHNLGQPSARGALHPSGVFLKLLVSFFLFRGHHERSGVQALAFSSMPYVTTQQRCIPIAPWALALVHVQHQQHWHFCASHLLAPQHISKKESQAQGLFRPPWQSVRRPRTWQVPAFTALAEGLKKVTGLTWTDQNVNWRCMVCANI